MRWMVKGSNLCRGKIFPPVYTNRGAHPACSRKSTGSFMGVKRPGNGVNHLPPSSTEVKERVELYLYSLSVLLWQVLMF